MLITELGDQNGTVLAAIMLGEKAGMEPELKSLYQANGIGHILAISGLHLSLIGLGAYRLLRRLTGSYLAGGAAGILFLGTYVLMIGVTVSAADIMTCRQRWERRLLWCCCGGRFICMTEASGCLLALCRL